MKVLKVSLAKAVTIGSSVADHIHPAGEIARLYNVTYDSAGRFIRFKSKGTTDESVTLVPLENVTSLQLSEEETTEKPVKDSVNGGTKKK